MKNKLFVTLLMLFTSTFLFAQVPNIVTLSSPADVATGVALNVSLTWLDPGDSGGGAVDAYYIQIDDDSGFGSVLFEGNIGNVLTYAPAGLAYNTTYYWRVQAHNIVGYGTYSAARSFTTILGPPTAIAASTISTTSFDANWTAHVNGGATSYRLDVGSTPGGTDISSNVNVGLVTTSSVTGLTAGTTYYYKVRAVNAGGTSVNSNEISQITVTGAPVATAATGMTTTSFSANWGAVTGAASYRIDVGTTPGGTDIRNDFILGLVTTYSVTGLTAGTTYYFKIRAVNAGGTSASSNEITTITVTNAPIATAATGMTTTSFSANWGAVTGAASYRIDVGTTPGGTDIRNDFVLGLVTSYSVTGLTAGTIYYFKVRAVNAGGTSANSNEISTITLTGPPTLSTPVNGLTGVSVLPTLTWGSVTGAATYKIYVDDNSDCLSPFFSTDIGSGTSYSFNAAITDFPLTNGTLFYWKVAGVNTSGEGTASTIFHFTTTPAMTVSLSTPTEGGTIYTSPTSFSWFLSTPTTGLQFIVQYKYAAAPPTGAEDETFWSGAGYTSVASTTSLTTSQAVIYGKTYYWRVLVQRTAAPNDYVYYPMANVYGTFSTAGGGTVTVTPSWPTGGETVYTNAPTLYWYLDQYATGLTYYINYSTSSATGGSPAALTGGGGALNVSTGSGNLYYTLPTLTPGTTYYWQVRSYYAAGDPDSNPATGTDGFSAWTTPTSFVTNGSGTLQVPIPSYPTGGVTVYTTSPTVYWYFNTAVTGLTYQVDWVDSTAGGGHSQSANTLAPTSYQITGLTAGNTIGWRVRSYNGTNYSNYSSISTFVVAGGTTASYTVASYPIGNPTVYTNLPTLYWYLEGSSLGISSYIVKYKISSAPANWITFDGSANNASAGQYTGISSSTFSKLITANLTYGATYYWAVYATGTTSFNPLGEGSFTVVGGLPTTTITLSTPSDASTVYSTSTTLNWYVNGSSAGITSYTLMFSQSDVFAGGSPITETYTVTAPSTFKALTGLTNGATYYWKVKANYAVDPSTAFSSTWSFTINTGAPSVVQPLVGGPNNVTVNTSSPMLSWVLPAPTAANSTYELQLAENPNFQSARIFSSAKSNMVVSGLVGGKSYFWKVRSKDETGNTSYYSGTGQFRIISSVTALEEKEIIPTQFELSQNYPNPFNPTTKISYALPQNSYVSIKVYDMLGREVRSLVSSEMSAGNHSVDWNGDDNNGNKVVSGIYLYKITESSFVSVKKMILIK